MSTETMGAPLLHGSRFLVLEEVAARQRRSRRSIYAQTRLHAIPFVKLAGSNRCLFREDHLAQWEAGAELVAERLPNGGLIVRPVGPHSDLEPAVSGREPEKFDDPMQAGGRGSG